MKRYGDPNDGLLEAIIAVFNEQDDPSGPYPASTVTSILKGKGYWCDKDVATPERTVNSYLSENSLSENPEQYFNNIPGSPGWYVLAPAYQKKR